MAISVVNPTKAKEIYYWGDRAAGRAARSARPATAESRAPMAARPASPTTTRIARSLSARFVGLLALETRGQEPRVPERATRAQGTRV
jgi:hypothetical protein